VTYGLRIEKKKSSKNALRLDSKDNRKTPQSAKSRNPIVTMCPEKSDEKPLVFKAGNTAIKIYRYKSRRYPRFAVTYYVAGRRRRDSFANLSDAKRRAQEVVASVMNDQLGALQLTNADRQRYEAAIDLLRPLRIPLNVAVEEYVTAKAELNGHPLLAALADWKHRRRLVIERRVREVVSEFLIAKQRDNVSQRYLQTIRNHTTRFAAAFETSISSITSGLIDEWIYAQRVGPQSRNNIRMSLVTLFRFARSRGYLPRGQTTEADEVPRAKIRNAGKIGILTPQQLVTLLDASNAEARLYFAIGAFTGLRSAEIIRLEWCDVNLVRGHIEVGKDKAKTATRRLVPIQPNLMQWLAPYRGREGRILSERKADGAIALAKQTIGEWPYNALRHSFATYRLAQCHDAARVALEMGNSPQILFRNYRELADEQDAAAWFSIASKTADNVLDMRLMACQTKNS
jgi:integrase